MLEEKILLDKTPNRKGIWKVFPIKASLRILRMEILIVCDSLVTDVASRLYFSQIYISVSFLKCLCQKNFSQKPQGCSGSPSNATFIYFRRKRFLPKTSTCVCSPTRVHWEWLTDFNYPTFWGPPSLLKLQETPPHPVTSVHRACSWQWHQHHLLSVKVLKSA